MLEYIYACKNALKSRPTRYVKPLKMYLENMGRLAPRITFTLVLRLIADKGRFRRKVKHF